jgi:hypothetical protein
MVLRQAYLSMVRRAYNPWLQYVQETSPAAARCGCRRQGAVTCHFPVAAASTSR